MMSYVLYTAVGALAPGLGLLAWKRVDRWLEIERFSGARLNDAYWINRKTGRRL